MIKDSKGLAERYAVILNELSNKEKVNIHDLEDLTGYGIRNLQLDLNQRLKTPFRIETDKRGNYWMDKKYRGLFSVQDIEKLSKIIGIEEIFPELDGSFITDIIDSKSSKPFIFKSPYKESLKGNTQFDLIAKAISKSVKLKFTYFKGDKWKRHLVEPYRLVNNYGTWYLFAVEKDILKSFKLSKIDGASQGFDSFSMDEDIIRSIEESDTVWISKGESIEVKLRVAASFASYFIDNISLPGQKNCTTEDDGSLIVTVKVFYLEEIKNIIKYWIPRIIVIAPSELRDEIKKELTTYMNL